MNILVTGSGGFIAGHLIPYLIKHYPNTRIFGIDIKKEENWFQVHKHTNLQNVVGDLRDKNVCSLAVNGMDWVFNLACDRGGIQYIVDKQVESIQSVLINTNLLEAAHRAKVKRYLFTSSVCVYSPQIQEEGCKPIKEDEVWGIGRPNESYGIEKLFSEEACNAYNRQYGMETRLVRFNTVYGGFESLGDNREKAPSALCRKVVQAKRSGKNELEIWGTGNQQRTFLYIDDCVKGIDLIMNGDDPTPFNLGPSELVTINQLVDTIEDIADIKLKRIYRTDKPTGSNIRNIDGSKFKNKFGWEPSVKISEGIPLLYKWVEDSLK